jgi:hypothetical protein
MEMGAEEIALYQTRVFILTTLFSTEYLIKCPVAFARNVNPSGYERRESTNLQCTIHKDVRSRELIFETPNSVLLELSQTSAVIQAEYPAPLPATGESIQEPATCQRIFRQWRI